MTLDMLPVMHIFNNHNKLKSQPQSEYKTGCVGQTWIQPEQWWREDGSYDKGDDYLWGCSGGKLLHCRGSESGGAAS